LPIAQTIANEGFGSRRNGIILQDRPKGCVVMDVIKDAWRLKVSIIAKHKKKAKVAQTFWNTCWQI
jgi:hypothetical protein